MHGKPHVVFGTREHTTLRVEVIDLIQKFTASPAHRKHVNVLMNGLLIGRAVANAAKCFGRPYMITYFLKCPNCLSSVPPCC